LAGRKPEHDYFVLQSATLCLFRRTPGDPPRYFAYLVNGLIGAVVAFAICLPFDLTNAGDALPPSLLSFAICTAVALCCDDWVEDRTLPA